MSSPETPPSQEEVRKEQVDAAADSRAVKKLAKDLKEADDKGGNDSVKEGKAFLRVQGKADRKADRQDNRAERFRKKEKRAGEKGHEKREKSADEKAQKARDRAHMFRDMEEASKNEDVVTLQQLGEAALHADDPVETTEPKVGDNGNEKNPELVESMASKWEIVLKGLARDLVNSIPAEEDTFGKYTYGIKGKVFCFLVGIFGPDDATVWAKDIDADGRKLLAAKFGLTLVEENGILAVKWTEPTDPDYQPESRMAYTVLEKYFKGGLGSLEDAFRTIKPNTTVKQLREAFNKMSDGELKTKYKEFISAIDAATENGKASDDVVVFKFISKNGNKLLTPEEQAEFELESKTEGKMIALVNKLKFEKKTDTTVKDFLGELNTIQPEWTELETSFETLFSSEDKKDISGVKLSEFIERENGLKDDPLNRKLYDAIAAKLKEMSTVPEVPAPAVPSPAPNSTGTVKPRSSDTPALQ
ncbi:MAG: hypothetical protein WC846_01550 [Candidatus Gracilibacteria bacterium]|jgi:hypothetical protein